MTTTRQEYTEQIQIQNLREKTSLKNIPTEEDSNNRNSHRPLTQTKEQLRDEKVPALLQP
jgi:hypothetical protein